MSPALAGRFFITSDTWEAHIQVVGFGFESNIPMCLVCTHFIGICYSGEIGSVVPVVESHTARQNTTECLLTHLCFLLTGCVTPSKPFSLSIIYFLIRKTISILPKLPCICVTIIWNPSSVESRSRTPTSVENPLLDRQTACVSASVS